MSDPEAKASLSRVIFDREVFPIAPVCDDPEIGEDDDNPKITVYHREFLPEDYEMLLLPGQKAVVTDAPPGEYFMFVTLSGSDNNPLLLFHLFNDQKQQVKNTAISLRDMMQDYYREEENLFGESEIMGGEDDLEDLAAMQHEFNIAWNDHYYRQLFDGMLTAEKGFWKHFPDMVDNVLVAVRQKMKLALRGDIKPLEISFQSGDQEEDYGPDDLSLC